METIQLLRHDRGDRCERSRLIACCVSSKSDFPVAVFSTTASEAHQHISQGLIPPYCMTAPSPTGPLSDTVSCIISESSGYISLLDKKFQVIKRWKGWGSQGESRAGDGKEVEQQAKGKGKARERGVMLLECGGVLLGVGVSPQDGTLTHQHLVETDFHFSGRRLTFAIPDSENMGPATR